MKQWKMAVARASQPPERVDDLALPHCWRLWLSDLSHSSSDCICEPRRTRTTALVAKPIPSQQMAAVMAMAFCIHLLSEAMKTSSPGVGLVSSRSSSSGLRKRGSVAMLMTVSRKKRKTTLVHLRPAKGALKTSNFQHIFTGLTQWFWRTPQRKIQGIKVYASQKITHRPLFSETIPQHTQLASKLKRARHQTRPVL